MKTGEILRTPLFALAAFLTIGADEPALTHLATPSGWLQEHLDRILARTGRAPGDVKAVIAETTDLPWVHPAGTLQFPRALLVMAPSAEAVDAMLAMLLSYGQEEANDGRHGAADAPLARIRGNGSDADGRQDSLGFEAGSGRAPVVEEAAEVRRRKAWQGARWNGQIGNCAAVQTDFLRATGREARITLDGKPMTWPGSPFSRKVIEYLGAQAYPGEERCRTRPDPDFARIRQALQGVQGP